MVRQIFGTDYTALEQITISAGETTGTITATLVNDSVYEGDETAILNITGVSVEELLKMELRR